MNQIHTPDGEDSARFASSKANERMPSPAGRCRRSVRQAVCRPASRGGTGRSTRARAAQRPSPSANSLASAGSNTFPAMPARPTFEVTGTTWVCQTSTLSTSSEESTTHGRRSSRSIQDTAPSLPRCRTLHALQRCQRLRHRWRFGICEFGVNQQLQGETQRGVGSGMMSELIDNQRGERDTESVDDRYDVLGNADRLVRHVRMVHTCQARASRLDTVFSRPPRIISTSRQAQGRIRTSGL